MKLRGSRFLWVTGLYLSKSTQTNVNGFTSVQNRTLHNMLQRALTYAIKTKVKEQLLGPKFLWKPEENWNLNRTFTPVNSEDPELKKDLVARDISKTSHVCMLLKCMFYIGQGW